MRPVLTDDGAAVLLPAAEVAATVLDELADAYHEDRHQITALLAQHAEARAAAEHAEDAPLATDYERAMRAAEADGTRQALADELPTAGDFTNALTPRAAFRLADDLTALAARITVHRQGGPHL